MMQGLILFGILYLAYCLIGGIVLVSAWERRVREAPDASPFAVMIDASVEGALWPVTAFRMATGREGSSDV